MSAEVGESKPAKKSEATGLAALGAASARTGTQHPLLQAMGGVLGIFETVVPGLIFLVVYTATGFEPGMPWLAIILSVAAAAGFTLWRIIRRQVLTQAIAGFVTVGISAALAIFSNRPENNFVIGLWTNAGYGTAFLISVLVGWPLAGLFVGFARQEGTAWRANKHHRRVFSGVTLLWVGMFALRLIVEVPLFLAGEVAALAATKLALGLPLYVPVLAISWLVIRGLYREKPSTQVS
jgi:hypothetical protein